MDVLGWVVEVARGLVDALAQLGGTDPWRTLAEVAGTLGLRLEPPDRGALPRASGLVGNRRVTIDVDGSNKGFAVEVGTDQRVTVRARDAWSDGRSAGVRTGDDAFDDLVVLEAPDGGHRRHSPEGRWASAVLDAPLRAHVRAAVARGAVHEHGRWTAPLDLRSGPAPALETIRALLALAERMNPGDLAGALRERALHDPVPAVRALAADRLLTWLGAQKTRDAAFVAVLERELPLDVDRARAARLRGRAGEATLRALLTHAAPPVRVEAALGLDALGERVEAELVALLPHGDPRVLPALALSGTVAAVPALRAITEPPDRVDAARDAIRAIQNRAVGAERGAISLVDPGAAGGLSEAAAADAGGLSPPKDR